jgi:hypothetical protein
MPDLHAAASASGGAFDECAGVDCDGQDRRKTGASPDLPFPRHCRMTSDRVIRSEAGRRHDGAAGRPAGEAAGDTMAVQSRSDAIVRIFLVTMLGIALVGAGSEALAAKSKAASSQSSPAMNQDDKISLYAEPVAFMNYCDIKMNDDALVETLTSVGFKSSAVPLIKSRAEKYVTELHAQYDTSGGKFDFCKRSKTIPVIKKWTATDE